VIVATSPATAEWASKECRRAPRDGQSEDRSYESERA
jgi:hypothetical protein